MIVWVLLLVTAVSPDHFITERYGEFDTIAACHLASTVEFWDQMPVNQEALCIRVETHNE